LAAGLRPDPRWGAKALPKPPSRNKGVLLLRGAEGKSGKGDEKGGEGKGEEREKRRG